MLEKREFLCQHYFDVNYLLNNHTKIICLVLFIYHRLLNMKTGVKISNIM